MRDTAGEKSAVFVKLTAKPVARPRLMKTAKAPPLITIKEEPTDELVEGKEEVNEEPTDELVEVKVEVKEELTDELIL